MHEQTLMADIVHKLAAVSRINGARRITSVRMKIGALSHISSEHFQEHFFRAIRGTVAEGCRLDVEVSSDPQDPHAQDILLDSVDLELAPSDDAGSLPPV